MLITIQLTNESEMKWLEPLVSAMREASMSVVISHTEKSVDSNRYDRFINVIRSVRKPIPSSITFLSREERNAR